MTQKIQISLMTLVLAVTLLGFSVQSALAQAEFETASYTFPDTPVKEYDDATLERISRLSEKYIMSTITPDELAELKKLDADLSDIDKYKAEYETTKNATVNSDENIIMDDRMMMQGAPVVNQQPMNHESSIAGPFGKYNDLALPLSLINTLLILMLLVPKSKATTAV